MDTPVTPSIGLFHADKQTVEALGPVVQLAKSGFFYCTQGEMSLVLGNRAFEIHRGDIYIYPPLSKTYIRMLSDDLHGTVGVADFDFVFTLANSISNTQNHLYMRENPCISLNDEQRRRIEELIELIWRRERSQALAARMRITVSSTTNCSRRSARRSAAKSPRPTFSTIRSSRSNRIARTGFSRVSSSRSPRISARTTAFRSTPRSSASPRAISPRSSGKNRAATPCNGS